MMYSTSRLRKSRPIWFATAHSRSAAKKTYENWSLIVTSSSLTARNRTLLSLATPANAVRLWTAGNQGSSRDIRS